MLTGWFLDLQSKVAFSTLGSPYTVIFCKLGFKNKYQECLSFNLWFKKAFSLALIPEYMVSYLWKRLQKEGEIEFQDQNFKKFTSCISKNYVNDTTGFKISMWNHFSTIGQ